MIRRWSQISAATNSSNVFFVFLEELVFSESASPIDSWVDDILLTV